MLGQNPALVRAKCHVMNTNCNLGVNVNSLTRHPCFRGLSDIAQVHRRLPVNSRSRAVAAWGNRPRTKLR